VAAWTWYPVRNADWLRAHADRSPRAWATAQGLATLPLAALGYALTWAWFGLGQPDWPMPLGPRPLPFVGAMLAIGLLASWLGTLCWNEASQRLPTALAGQLIVFETLSALAYAYALRQQFPPPPRWPAWACWWPAWCGRCGCGPCRCRPIDRGQRRRALPQVHGRAGR
jgi:drug/metabolite transporter (DMT)-like permease